MPDILRILIENALQNGEISEADYLIIKKKAQDMGISEAQLQKIIEEVKGKSSPKAEEDNLSGFITLKKKVVSDKKTKPTEPTQPTSASAQQQYTQPIEQKFTDITPLDTQGAMGMVFKARQYGKWVIIKRLKPEFRNNPKYRELFMREFETGYHLDHPNIVKILDKGEDNEGPYIVMEYIDGRPLRELIKADGIGNEKLALRITKQILDALSYVHKKQIYHRDLKPENIFITYRGDNVKILDFGLSTADYYEDDMLKVGTPKYASPEQLTKGYEADQRSDIYSVGKILLEMLTGSTEQSAITKIKNKQLQQVIKKAIEKNPQDRFYTADEMLEALNNISFEQPKTSQPIPKETSQQKTKKSLIPIFIGIGILVLALIGVLIFMLNKKSSKKSQFQSIITQADSLYQAGYYVASLEKYKQISEPDENIQNKIHELTPLVEAYHKAEQIKTQKNLAKSKKILDSLLQIKPNFQEAKKLLNEINQKIEKIDLFSLEPIKSSATGKYGLQDAEGNIIVDFQFDEIAPKKDWHKVAKIIPVRCGKKWGFINSKKQLFEPCIYEGIKPTGKYVWVPNGFRIGKDGKIVIIHN